MCSATKLRIWLEFVILLTLNCHKDYKLSMLLLNTTDARVKISPTIHQMAGALIGDFFQQHYKQDCPVRIYHEADLDIVTDTRSTYRTIGSWLRPTAVFAFATAAAGSRFIPEKISDAVARVLYRPLPDMWAWQAEDSLRTELKKTAKRTGFGAAYHENDAYTIFLSKADKTREVRNIGPSPELLNEDALAGTTYDWQMNTLGHEIGHVLRGIQPSRDRYSRIADEGIADSWGRRFYMEAAERTGSEMDKRVPDHWQILRRAALIKFDFARVHFPGEEVLAHLAENKQHRDHIFKAYDQVAGRYFEDMNSYHPRRVHQDLKHAHSIVKVDPWCAYWVEQCQKGWEELHELGVVNVHLRSGMPREANCNMPLQDRVAAQLPQIEIPAQQFVPAQQPTQLRLAL